MAKSKEDMKQFDLIKPPLNYEALLKPDKTIRIALSGDVLITGFERRIIDTYDFQRLRGIRELGMASYVYPSSNHTRFDHSLGTLAMASRMIERIRANSHSALDERTISPIEEILIRLYALLHDITHIPFGHTLEDELNIFPRHDKNEDRIKHFFNDKSDIGKIIIEVLGQAGLNRFLAIYKWDKKVQLENDDAFIYDIVSNTVCADLLDYLARDNYFCNLGVSLEYRFLNFLYLRRDERNQRRIFVRLFKANRPIPRRDTLTDLCRLLETRYLIAERVYYHHAKITASTMLGRAIYEMKESGELTEGMLYKIGDDTLLHNISASNAEVASRLGRSLLRRRLHKQLHKYHKSEFLGLQSQDHNKKVVDEIVEVFTNPRERKEFEDKLADEVGAAPGDILVYCPPGKMNLKIAEMKVIWEGKEYEFKDITDPIINPRLREIVVAHQLLWGVLVLVNPSLDDDQKRLVKNRCDIKFLTPDDEKPAKEKEYFEKLIDRVLSNIAVPNMDASQLYQKRETVVSEMMSQTKDDRPFYERVSDTINRIFTKPKAPTTMK